MKVGPPQPSRVQRACGKKSDALVKCRACKCVWYCDKECQNKHWKEHKKECKRIKKALDKRGGKLDVGSELDIGPLGKVPSREECPICMRVLPIHTKLQCYFACCGKTLCCGCNLQHQTQTRAVNAKRAKRKQPLFPSTCAFCRTEMPDSNEEILARARKRVELRDPYALQNLAMHYGRGTLGLPVDQTKCIQLVRQSAGLDFSGAQYQLGSFYDTGAMGLERNEKEALKYYEKAAEGGFVLAQHNLGCTEQENGNFVTAMRHLRLAASVGFKPSIEALIQCFFEVGLLHHADLAETAQAMYRARAEMKSEGRDQYIADLKKTGKYKEEYNC